jgi:hypothetical protein
MKTTTKTYTPIHTEIFKQQLPFIYTGIRQGILFFICVFILFWILATETEEDVDTKKSDLQRTPDAGRKEYEETPENEVRRSLCVGVLFHCDLVHAGAINTHGAARYVEQYKIAHVDDIYKLKHLQHINTRRTGKSYWYEIFTRKCSWIFSHIFNHHFTSYLQNRPDNHMGKMLLSLYGRDFYNT